jgi:hypothetical protein
MRRRAATVIAGLLITLAQTAPAQQAIPVPATPPLHFESWQATSLDHGSIPTARRITTVGRDKKDGWLIGGAVGAAAGIVFCTAMSTLMNDSASGGLSFCPLDSYLLIGGAGFLLGAAVGLAF